MNSTSFQMYQEVGPMLVKRSGNNVPKDAIRIIHFTPAYTRTLNSDWISFEFGGLGEAFE